MPGSLRSLHNDHEQSKSLNGKSRGENGFRSGEEESVTRCCSHSREGPEQRERKQASGHSEAAAAVMLVKKWMAE